MGDVPGSYLDQRQQGFQHFRTHAVHRIEFLNGLELPMLLPPDNGVRGYPRAMKPTVAIYTRLSFDDENTGLGVQRQEQDARKLCERLGWQVGQVYTDNNLSAYKKHVIRPAWEDMLLALESGQLGGIAAYDLDRISRQPRDLERLIDIYDLRSNLVFATVSGEIDLSKPDGRLMARVMVSFANKSSADTSRRVARAQLQRAQQGKLSGGGHTPYGYNPDGLTINQDHAAVVREAADRTLTGESLTSICRDLDHRGILTPSGGNRWNRGVLKRLMIHPRMGGLREYKGAILLGDDGRPVEAAWEPMFDMPTWESLVAVLTDKSRDLNAGRIDRKYLLSGFLRCHCGTKMYGVTKKGKAYYQCPIGTGCSRTCRVGAPIDAYVTEEVLRFLDQVIEPDGLQDQEDEVTSSLQVAISEAERSLSALIDEWNAGRISDQVFFTAQARKEASLNALRRQRGTQKRRQTLSAPVGLGVRDKWAEANLSQRRAILSEALQVVKVLKKDRNAPRRFDDSRYVVMFRTD
ncbi:putative DNA recombinase [Arthrobacter sp. Hiyo6]|nr:putative DNA recombinase [Arthrobacter sp. Hiyo6]